MRREFLKSHQKTKNMTRILQETECQRHMRKTLGLCRFLGLNASRWSEFKLAYDMVVINELGV